MSMNIDDARALISNYKQGEIKTQELCGEIVQRARDFLKSPDSYKEYLDFSARFYRYSFNNTMLIRMQNPHASYVGSFKHFKDMGYSVKKGEHGYTILVPVKVTLFERAGQMVRLKDATPDEKYRIAKKELPVHELTYFKPGTIFDISQTTITEKELPKFLGRMAPKKVSAKRYDQLKQFVEEHGIPVIEEDFHSVTLNGKYQLADDSIHLNSTMGVQNKYATIIHEFAHAIMHKNAQGNPDLTHQAIEFEAESVAYLVQRQTGADVSDYDFGYIAGYFGKMDDEAVAKSLGRIDKAAGYISTHLEVLKPEALPVRPQQEQVQEPQKPQKPQKPKLLVLKNLSKGKSAANEPMEETK